MSKNTFVFGTGNEGKLNSMRERLSCLDIEIKSIKECGVDIPEVDESGDTPLENARIKALAYYDILKRPVFACDSGFYIESLPEAEQPGIHVRMVNGKRLNDDEMIAHYSLIASKLGGKTNAQYKNAICLVMNENEIYEHFGDDISGEVFMLVDKPCSKRTAGYPLDSLSVHIESGEYYLNRKDDKRRNTAGGFQAFFRNVIGSVEK